jgi:hypothetical protein
MAVVVGMAFVLGGASRAGAEPRRLALVWVDPTHMTPGSYATLASESQAALSPLGAEVAWTEAADGVVLGPETLAVIAIPSQGRDSGAGRHVMGATQTGADGALAVWVFPDQVAWALGLDLQMRRSWGKMKERDFARALGRVASHEVLHSLGVTDHGGAGLMSAHLDRLALTAARLPIDRATASAARRALSRGTLSASPAGVLTSSASR